MSSFLILVEKFARTVTRRTVSDFFVMCEIPLHTREVLSIMREVSRIKREIFTHH
jgi:hypothetical protein